HDHAGWDLLLTAHALILILVLIAPAARQAGPVGRFLGDWYPMLLLGGLYAEVGVLNVDLAYQHDLAGQRLAASACGAQRPSRWGRPFRRHTSRPRSSPPCARCGTGVAWDWCSRRSRSGWCCRWCTVSFTTRWMRSRASSWRARCSSPTPSTKRRRPPPHRPLSPSAG